MNEELKKYYDYLKISNADVPDNYESFAETLSDEAQAKTYFDYLKANKFDTPDTYESFAETFNLQKKKASPLELATTGQTVLQELGQPLNESITPKLPFQQEKKPKVSQEETFAIEPTVTSVLQAQRKLPEYLQGEQERIVEESTQAIKDELTKLKDNYQKKIEANPEKQEELKKQFKEEQDKVIELRSANIPMAVESLYKKGKDYKWLDPADVKGLSEMARNIASKPVDFLQKKDALEGIKKDFMSKVGTLTPEEQSSIEKELNDVIAQSSVVNENGVPSVFGWKSEVANKNVKVNQRIEELSKLPETEETKTEYNLLYRAQKYYDRILRLPDDEGSFLEGFKSEGRNMLTAGMAELFDTANIAKISRKQAEGEPLSKGEQALYDAYGVFQTAQNADQFGKAYERGKGIAGSVAFMESFALTGGLAGIGEKTALKMLGNQVKNKVVQNIAKGIGGAVVRTPLLTGGMTETAKRMAGSPTLTETGEFKVDPSTIEPTIQAIGKGLYSNFANALGETAGGWLAGTKVNKFVGSALGLNKIPKGVAKIFNTVGMQPLGELPEEYLTTLMETPVMGDQTLAEAFSPEAVWETAVQVGLMSGFFSGIALPSVMNENIKRKQNSEMIRIFGKDKIAEIRSAIENKDQEAFKTALSGLEATTDQKKQIVRYANSLAQQKGAEVAQEAANIESQESAEDVFKKDIIESSIGEMTGTQRGRIRIVPTEDGGVSIKDPTRGTPTELKSTEDAELVKQTAVADVEQINAELEKRRVAKESNAPFRILGNTYATKEEFIQGLKDTFSGQNFDAEIVMSDDVQFDNSVSLTEIMGVIDEITPQTHGATQEVPLVLKSSGELKALPPFYEARIRIADNAKKILQPKTDGVIEGATEGVSEGVKIATPQEIAQGNDISFIGKQEGETEAESLDLYNVKVGENEATFAVPSGSNEATVQAKKQETVDRFAPKSSLQEQPTITEESEKDNISAGDVQKTEVIQPKLKEEDYDLTEDEAWKFEYDLLTSLGLRGTKDYHVINGNTILRVKGHTPNWSNFTEQLNDNPNIERVINITVGDYNNTDSRKTKTTLEQIQKEFPDIEFIDITVEDGESLNNNIRYLAKTLNQEVISQESSLEAKQPTTAPITEKTTEVPPKPPSVVKQAENASEGGKKTREIGAKVIESANVSQEVKDALLENGIDYIPRGKKITQTEAKEIVDAFSTNEDGLDKLAKAVYDIKNDIAGDTRVTLNVYIAEKYSKLLDEATDTKTREKYRNKVAEAFIFGQEFATSAGQTVEAMKRWRELLSRDPESIIAIKKRQQRKTNDFVLQGMESDIKSAKELLDSVVNTDEFKKFVETEVNKEIDKIANKKYGEVDKKKINDFFDSLIIKNDKAYDATVGIPIAVYNGAMLTIKKAVLAGVDIANAIKQAVDYIDTWYKENYAKGTTPSPEWNKDDYVAQMNTLLKPLTKKVKKVKMKVSKEVEDSLVDKIYAKMSNATKPQLRRLVREYISTLESEGAINEQRFKDLFAQAIGLDVLTAEDEQKIRETAQSLKNATKTAEKLVEKFKELVNETDNAKIKQLEEEVKTLKKEANKAKFEAQKAAKKLSDLMTDKATLGTTIHTLIQGNLLTPISLVSNVVGNTMFLPVRNVSYMVSSGLDMMISKLSSLYTPLLGDPWVKANPRIRRLIESLPTPSREYDYFASTRGYWYGVPVGLQEGIRQVWTGTLPEDQYQQYIGQGLNPWKAALRARDQMTGKEQIAFDTFLANLLEAFPTTYMAEGFFRALNLGDKPYRRAAERSRLEELATLKGLKGNQRESFINNPDPDSVEEARKAGDIAVYQQDTIVSELFSYLNKKINRVVSKDGAKRTSVIISTVGALLKATQAPYVKTPVNLIGEAIDYSIPALSMFRALYYAKEGNKRKSYEYFGKAAVGYMLMNVAFFLIKEGLLTPPTDDDEKVRQAQYDAKPGYSLNIDALWRKISKDDAEWKDKDQVMNIQRLGVFSMILMGMSKAYAEFPPDEMQKEMSFMDKSSYSLRMIPAEVGASLEQSFLSGTASGIKAFTEGGPAFDKWVISTSKALSAVVYPNTVAQISQVFFDDNYIREVRDMYSRDDKFKKQITNTFKDRTFMGKDLPAKVTLWGERVNRVPEGESWAHVMFDVTKSVEYQKSSFGVRMFEWYERMKFIDETEAKKILPSIPSGSNTVGWDDRNMTAKEVEEFQMMVGQRRKSYVENMMNSEEWALLSDEDKILELEKVYRTTASKVKAGMFMLDVIKADKKVFKFLEENDMIPVPSKAVVITYQRKKVKLTPEETIEYYQNVQRHFVERINNTNLLEDKVERDEKGQERLLKQINGHWDKSKEAAERFWKAEQNKQ